MEENTKHSLYELIKKKTEYLTKGNRLLEEGEELEAGKLLNKASRLEADIAMIYSENYDFKRANIHYKSAMNIQKRIDDILNSAHNSLSRPHKRKEK